MIHPGTRFGRLMVIRERELFPLETHVLVCCDCGDWRSGWSEPFWAEIAELRRTRENRLRSCGCLARERGDANLRPGTSMPGERNPAARLSEAEVAEIRARLAAGGSGRGSRSVTASLGAPCGRRRTGRRGRTSAGR